MLFQFICRHSIHKLVNRIVVISGVVKLRGQHHADRIGREVLNLSPKQRWEIETVISSVQRKLLPLETIVDNHVKAARGGDDVLMTGFEGVARTAGAAWHVIEVNNAFNIKRDVPRTLNERQVAARMRYARQIDKWTLSQVLWGLWSASKL